MMHTIKTIRKPSEERTWLKYFPKGASEAELPTYTMYSYLKQVCQTQKDKPAVYYYGTTVSYEKLLEKIDRVADAFYTLGVR